MLKQWLRTLIDILSPYREKCGTCGKYFDAKDMQVVEMADCLSFEWGNYFVYYCQQHRVVARKVSSF